MNDASGVHRAVRGDESHADAAAILSDLDRVVTAAIRALLAKKPLDERHLFVVGASTSEIGGGSIGKASNLAFGEAIVQAVLRVQAEVGFHVAFQCCEHLNRALVVERRTMERFHLEEVTARPVPEAGGALAAAAYDAFEAPVLVEAVRADAGLDIGETLIGMHLKPVVVPFRPPERTVGAARVNMAYSRPKLIGGPRAQYP
ncbi:MAG: TIGR01440 family protein [Hydrogenibacillus sp.]|nr:TIGR01440 family protein [Hydrogenibacillus sp.]